MAYPFITSSAGFSTNDLRPLAKEITAGIEDN